MNIETIFHEVYMPPLPTYALPFLLAIPLIKRIIYLHAFLDGRDTPPRSAEASLIKVQNTFNELFNGDANANGQIASVIGRYYAMDRDQRWDRVERLII